MAELYNNGWFRSNGQVGWYNQTYGGGIHMTDSSYVRVYGGKGFATDTHTLEQGTGGIWTSRYGWLENCF
ncbi:shufflon system plasmid conjugative transfer pilus tip adhesin PilV, partial [Acinetobacter baumannii]|uniref:shufflon system plasmid conjugative transfer pilus tip adhesin PilV n=1 Tax=Acinetobacter baumannii TaxID=470 RepID=UPI0033974F3B